MDLYEDEIAFFLCLRKEGKYMKLIKSVVIILFSIFLLTGCSMKWFDKAYELPDNAQSYVLEKNKDTGSVDIRIDGKTYSLYGKVKGKMNSDYIRDCLGYVDGNINIRIYTLVDDASDKYILVLNISEINGQPEIYRDMDTWQQDILTPSYIESCNYESWGAAGKLHYEE